MSLIRLLTVGRALGGVRDKPSPYRMVQGLLPKFGGPNPFMAPPTGGEGSGTVPAPLSAQAAGGLVPDDQAAAPARPAPPAEPPPADAAVSPRHAPERPVSFPPPRARAWAGRLASWSRAICGGMARGSKKAAARAVRLLSKEPKAAPSEPFRAPVASAEKKRAPAPARPPTGAKVQAPLTPAPAQGELALWSVRVVRNDLHDADLEVQPVAPVPEPEPKPGSVSSPSDVGAGGAGWGRWATSWLHRPAAGGDDRSAAGVEGAGGRAGRESALTAGAPAGKTPVGATGQGDRLEISRTS